MNPIKHSIKYLKERMENPNLYKRRSTCEHLNYVSQLIKSRTGEDSYTNSYYMCNYFKLRISRRHCMNCKFYKKLEQ